MPGSLNKGVDVSLPVFRVMWLERGTNVGGMDLEFDGFYAVQQNGRVCIGPFLDRLSAGKAARAHIIAQAPK